MATNIVIQLALKGVAGARTAFNSLQGQLQNTQKATQGVTAGFVSIAKTIGIGGLVIGAYSALKNAVAASVGEFIEFDKRLREINTILPNNGKVTKELTQDLKDLADVFATGREEQAKAFYQIISAGTTDATEATKLLTAANTLALGGLSDLGSSINVLTDIVNVYGKGNITAAEAADSLFKTVELGKVQVSDLSSNLGAILPTGAALGVSLDEINAALAVLTTRGQSTSERVTQLNAIFTAVLKKGSEAKKFGKDIGEAFSIKSLRDKGLVKFLEELIVATGGSEEILTKLFGRVEGSKAVISLASDGFKKLNETIVAFETKAGAADKAAEEIKKSFQFKFDTTIRGFKNIGAAIAEAFAPATKAVLDSLNNTFRETGILAKGNVERIKVVKKEIKRLEGAFNKLGNQAKFNFGEGLFKKWLKAKVELGKLEKKVGDTRRKAEEKITVDIDTKALLKFRAELGRSFDDLKKKLKDVGKTSTQIANEAFDKNKELLDEALKNEVITRKQFNDVKSKLEFNLQKEIATIQAKALKERQDKEEAAEKARIRRIKKLREDFEKDIAPITTGLGILSGAQQGSAGLFKAGAQQALEIFKDVGGELAEAIAGPMGKALTQIVDIFGQSPEQFQKMIVDAFTGLPELLSNIIVNVLSLGAGTFIDKAITGLIDNLPFLIESVTRSLVRSLASPVFWIRVAVAAANAFVQSIPLIVQGFIDGIKDGIGDVVDPLKRAGTFIQDAGRFFFNEILRGGAQFVGKIISGAADFLNKLLDGISGGVLGGGSSGIPVIGGIIDSLGFARGGQVNRVPSGFPSDSFPARLTSGELVVDRSTASRLADFLDGQGNGQNNSGITDSLLTRVIDLLERPISTSAEVNLNSRTFAEIMIQLDRTNTRVTA